MLDSAARSVGRLGEKIEECVTYLPGFGCGVDIRRSRIKKTDASKLQDEYAKLVEGLQEAADNEDAFMSNPGKTQAP